MPAIPGTTTHHPHSQTAQPTPMISLCGNGLPLNSGALANYTTHSLSIQLTTSNLQSSHSCSLHFRYAFISALLGLHAQEVLVVTAKLYEIHGQESPHLAWLPPQGYHIWAKA